VGLLWESESVPCLELASVVLWSHCSEWNIGLEGAGVMEGIGGASKVGLDRKDGFGLLLFG
jgi:hypothetical protein